jgi:hypothetical protein
MLPRMPSVHQPQLKSRPLMKPCKLWNLGHEWIAARASSFMLWSPLFRP